MYKQINLQLQSVKCCYIWMPGAQGGDLMTQAQGDNLMQAQGGNIMMQAQFNTDAPIINLIGMAAEVKLDDNTSSPIWECFHNMSAIGASVTMKALTLGVIVNRMIVYGLVLSIEMRDRRFSPSLCSSTQPLNKVKRGTQHCISCLY